MGGFLYTFLDTVQSQSTVINKIWMRGLFIFRLLVLGTAAEIIWADEQSRLVCFTQQPGCQNVCYDFKFPISQIRFWIIQVIFVSMPTFLYLCHVIHVIHQETKLREDITQQHDSNMINNPKYTDDQHHVKIQGNLLGSYLTHLFIKIILELAFIIGQYYLYGFFMSSQFNCARAPCPHSVDCYISRPTEKNIFNVFMLLVACVSVLLNVTEVCCLLGRRARRCTGMRKDATSAETLTTSSRQPKQHENKMI